MITIPPSIQFRSFRRTVPGGGLLVQLFCLLAFFCGLADPAWAGAAGSVLALAAIAPAPAVDPGPDALTNTLAQVAALQAEARALSPTQKKIATPLRDALREFRGDAPRPYAPKVRSQLRLRSGGMVLVDIRGDVSAGLLAYLQTQGATVQSSYPQYHSIRAEIPIAAVETIAAHADIKSIRPAAEPIANVGTATSEGVYAESVDTARADFGVDGSGVKVGVLSDSVRYGAISQTNGDLGGVTVLPGQSGIGSGGDEGEGTAMLEIVHDLAPGAQLYFATGFSSEASMASNIIALADAGCSVIIDDVTYNDESPFHANQPIAQAVKTVSDRGVLFFSSAANSGNFTHGTSGTWTGNFTTYGFDPTKGQLHNWGGTPYNQITKVSGNVTLFWSDPMGGATNDYDLFITDVNGNVLRSDMNQQSGLDTNDITGDPYETVPATTNTPEYVVVALASGTQRDIYVGTGRGQLAHATTGNTRGHNAAPADNAFCVAATTAKGFHSGLQFAGGAGNPVENFSSDGFPRLFFEADGSAVTPNNFTASGGRILLKPDITAADGVVASTNTFGTNLTFTPFYGTSAAAPHAGAIAALIKSYRPDLTPYQIRLAMMNTALDIESLGFDANSGAGIVMADAAMISVDNTPPLVAVTSPTNNAATNLLTNISGTASDIGSGLELNQIHFTLNLNGNFWSGTYWTNTSASDPSIGLTANVVSGVWTFTNVPTGGNQLQGTYYISAFARDKAGNVSQPLSGVTSTSFIVSTTPPAVAITSPLNGSTITNQPGGNWFQGTASGNLGVSIGVSLFIRRNSDNLYWTGSGWGDATNGFISNSYNTGAHTWQSTGPLPVPGSSLGNGGYHFIAVVRDVAGNQQQVDSVVSVDFHPVFVFTYGSQFGLTPNMSWNDPANWDVGRVPTSDARVVINGYSPDNTSVSNLHLYRLDLSAGTLTTAGMLITNLYISGGSLPGGVINIPATGTFNWSGGSLGAICNVPAGATFNLTGDAARTLTSSGLLTIGGTGTWSGTGQLQIAANAQLVNNGTLTVTGDATVFNYTGGAAQFINNGTLLKTAGTNTVFLPDNSGVAFNNNGVLSVQSGVFALGGGGAGSNGTFTAGSGAQVVLTAGSFTCAGTSTFSGAGATHLAGGILTYSGPSVFSGGATLAVDGGSLTGASVFTGTGTFNWTGGQIGAVLTLPATAAFNLTGDAAKTLTSSGLLTIGGTGTWSGAGQLQIAANAQLVNNGTLTVTGDATVFNYTGGAAQFINNGTLLKTAGTNTVFLPDNSGVAFNNNGVLSVQSGVFALGGGGAGSNGTFTAGSGAQVVLTAGSFTCAGTSTFSGAGATHLAGGILTYSGPSVFSGGATLAVDGGSLTGASVFTGTGTFNWTGGQIGAVLTLPATAAFNLTGDAAKTLTSSGLLTIGGTGTWSGAGQLQIAANAQLVNNGTLTVTGDATVFNYTGGAAQFINNGTLLKTVGTNTVFLPDNSGVAFNNNGVLNVQSGVFALGGGGAGSNGTFTAGSGAQVVLTAGSFTCAGTSTFSGAGATHLAGGILTYSGPSVFSGGATLAVDGGSLTGASVFTGTGTFNWTGGQIGAVLTLPATAAFNLTGDAAKTLTSSGLLTIGGTGTWSGAGQLQIAANAQLVNNGTLTVTGDATVFNYTGGAAQFINNGTLLKTAGTNTVFLPDNSGVAFNNNGVLSVQSGVFALGGGGAGSNGTFTAGSGAQVVLTAGSFTCAGTSTFSGAGATHLAGGILTYSGPSVFSGGATLAVDGGSLTGASVFTGTGTFNWTGGQIGAVLTLPATAAFNLTGDAAKTLTSSGLLTIGGTGTWSGAGQLQIAANAQLVNNGTLTVTGDATVFNYTGGAAQFINNGTLLKTVGTNTVFLPDNSGVAFNNNGVLNVQSGVFALGGGGAGSNGTFTAGSGAQVVLTAGSFTCAGTSTFSGAGATHLAGGILTYSGPSVFSGGATLAVDGGSLTGASVFTGTGTFNWTGGQIGAVLTLPATAAFNLTGDAAKTLTSSGLLTIGGTGTWSGAGQLQIAANAQLVNNGTLTVTGDATVFNYTGGAAQFINNGTLIKAAGTNTVFLPDNGGVIFNNNGTVDLRTGSLAINSYTLGGSPKLKMTLGGINPGKQFGQETFAGAATLGGILSVTLTNGFVPTNGQAFVLATYPSSTGQFATTQFPALPVQSQWQLAYNPTALVLQVVPSTFFQGYSLTSGNFQLALVGPAAASCRIDVSTNLLNWGPLLTNTPFTGTLNYVDPQTAQFSKRFYRATIFP